MRTPRRSCLTRNLACMFREVGGAPATYCLAHMVGDTPPPQTSGRVYAPRPLDTCNIKPSASNLACMLREVGGTPAAYCHARMLGDTPRPKLVAVCMLRGL
jgi:hypothetical protein